MSDTWTLILILAAATFIIRFAGIVLGQRLPASGPWARGLNALPGCLIVSLVSVLILSGGANEWMAGIAALSVALLTRSLPLTMLAGIGAVFVLRQWS